MVPAAPLSEPILSAETLTRTFTLGPRLRPGHVSAVDGVSLELRAGESLGIMGESGCGKTTLARMLVGLEGSDSGKLLYRGDDVTALKSADRKRLRKGVQLIFQDPYTSLDPRMTVQQLITEPLTANRLLGSSGRRDRAAELLSLVGLSDEMLGHYPHQFSGGQRQRIGIARGLARDPDVMVCDEPVSALDVSVQAQVVNLLRDLQARLGVAIVFIAHDLSVVRHLTHRVAVMDLGRLAEVGDSSIIFDAPAHPYTQGAALGLALGRPVPPWRAGLPDPADRRAAVPAQPARRLPLPPPLRIRPRPLPHEGP